MKNYLATAVYSICTGSGNHTPQFEEQLLLINANDEVQALQKAEYIATDNEESFQNAAGETVSCKFIGITYLNEFSEKGDGKSIYSRIYEKEESKSYIGFVKQTATLVQQKYIQKAVV